MNDSANTARFATVSAAVAVLLAVVGTGVAASVWAQQAPATSPKPAVPAPGTPAGTTPPSTASPPATQAPPAKPVDDATHPPAAEDTDTAPGKSPADTPSKPAAAKGSPQRFEPTEKVRPDFDVAFPVDI